MIAHSLLQLPLLVIVSPYIHTFQPVSGAFLRSPHQQQRQNPLQQSSSFLSLSLEYHLSSTGSTSSRRSLALLPLQAITPSSSSADNSSASKRIKRKPATHPPQVSSSSGQGGGEKEEEIIEFTTTGNERQLPLDILLVRRFPELSRRACRRLLQEGKIIVDGRVNKRPSKIGGSTSKGGALIQAYLPRNRESSQASLGFALEPENMDLTILYEDEHLLAVGKPPGIAVQPCESQRSGTLIHGVLYHLVNQQQQEEERLIEEEEKEEEIEGNVEENEEEEGEESGRRRRRRPPSILTSPTQGLVHRLDKHTSGVWIYAKSRLISNKLSSLFKSRAMAKTYLAVCHGNPCPKGKNEVLIDQPIFRKSNGKMAVPSNAEENEKAKMATSRVETLMTDGSLSLVRVQILTGRTHQIRVHLTHIGCPVLGDDVYCAPEFTRRNRNFRKLGLNRVLLHAYALSFTHPGTGREIDLLAPFPTDMLATVQYILREAAASKEPTAFYRLMRALRDGQPLSDDLLLGLSLTPPAHPPLRPVVGSAEEEEDDDDEEEGEED